MSILLAFGGKKGTVEGGKTMTHCPSKNVPIGHDGGAWL